MDFSGPVVIFTVYAMAAKYKIIYHVSFHQYVHRTGIHTTVKHQISNGVSSSNTE